MKWMCRRIWPIQRTAARTMGAFKKYTKSFREIRTSVWLLLRIKAFPSLRQMRIWETVGEDGLCSLLRIFQEDRHFCISIAFSHVCDVVSDLLY